MTLSTLNGDLAVTGRLTPSAIALPIDSVPNAAIPSAEQIEATKLQHQHRPQYSQPNTTATTVTIGLFVARFAGALTELVAGSIAACVGGATITVDLRKNGTTVLSSVLTLNSSNTARVAVAATISGLSNSYVAGDLFEIVVTATAGGGTIGTGFFCAANFNEHSQ